MIELRFSVSLLIRYHQNKKIKGKVIFMRIFMFILLCILIFMFINILISFIWIMHQPIGEMVGMQWSTLWFPLFKNHCKQHRYRTVDDEVNENMKEKYGLDWEKLLE